MSGIPRIAKDVQGAQSDEMQEMGIYYCPDDVNIRKGTALIIGPDDTPYEACPLFFSVEFPPDYPFKSPTILIITSDGQTRFHPNLYVTGKVCLSILGTYSGPSWSSIMNLKSVFMSILSLLTNNPITNEPAWEKYTLADKKAVDYVDWVQYRLISKTISDLRDRGPLWDKFKEVLEDVWMPKYLPKILKIIDERAAVPEREYTNVPYQMHGTTQWANLKAAAAACRQ